MFGPFENGIVLVGHRWAKVDFIENAHLHIDSTNSTFLDALKKQASLKCLFSRVTFVFSHLADAVIQSDLQTRTFNCIIKLTKDRSKTL